MFYIDFAIVFFIMSLLFLRQIVIAKQQNRINYAPLVISIGAIGSILHFIIHPDSTNMILILRESFIPFLVALILYIIMNILTQIQSSINSKMQEEFTNILVYEIAQLKEFISDLEGRMKKTQELSIKSQENIQDNFLKDIKELDILKENQNILIDEIKSMQNLNENINKSFKYFSEVQLPDLDNIVHKHIDILRIAEQDHYNKLKSFMEKISQHSIDIDVEQLKLALNDIHNLSQDISSSITNKTFEKLSSMTKSLESEMIFLKSYTDSLKDNVEDTQLKFENIKLEISTIAKHLELSLGSLDDIDTKSLNFNQLLADLNLLMQNVESIKTDYLKSQYRLSNISKDIENSKEEEIMQMKKKIDDLSDILSKKIDESLDKLHEHYHITSEDISQSVQMLAKKAQVQKGYSDLDL